MRRLHLIDKHHYPKHFPFDLVYTGTLSFEQRKQRDQENKQRLKKEQEHTKDVDMDELTNNMSKLKMPKSISFGRHSSPSIPQHRKHHYNTRSNKDIEMKESVPVPTEAEEKKVYLRPRKRGPKKKNAPTTAESMIIE